MKSLIKLACILLLANSANAQITQIPFEFSGKHLYIKVTTNNSDTLNFIFDSGSTNASIDSATAEKAGVSKENRQTVEVAGNGGVQNYSMAFQQTLKLGNVEVKDVNPLLINFASLSNSVGRRLDGIVGYEVLNSYVTQLDFDRKTLSLYKEIASVDTTGYTRIPFQFYKGVLIPRFPISVTLANGETFTGMAMFDTGNAFSFIVSAPFSKFHNFDSKLGEVIFTKGRGLHSETEDKQAVIKSMSFNGFDFGKMMVVLTINEKAEPKDGYLGILGIEVIKRFNVIMDYANKVIYMKPNKAFNEPFELGKSATEVKKN